MSSGVWHHIALVSDKTNDTGYLYVDASEIANTDISSASGDCEDRPFRVGASNFNPGVERFNGFVDDVRVFERAITQEELEQLAAGRYPSVDLDYLWSPTQGAETTYGPIANIGTAGTQDLSTGNVTGNMTWVSDTEKKGLYAADVEDRDHYVWTGFNTPYTPVTIGCWVKCNDADESGYIFNMASTGKTLFLGAEFRTSNQIRLWCDGTSTQVGDGNITKTDWNHVAVTYDGTDGRLFLNGSEIATKTGNQPTAYPEIKYGTAGGSVFGVEGRIDGMFLEHSVLSDDQILYLATDRKYNFTPPGPAPTPGGWKSPFRNSYFHNPFFDNEAL